MKDANYSETNPKYLHPTKVSSRSEHSEDRPLVRSSARSRTTVRSYRPRPSVCFHEPTPYCFWRQVFGIRGGFAGFYDERTPAVELTSAGVEMLQHEPGSVLG